jgi:hypothetical protein
MKFTIRISASSVHEDLEIDILIERAERTLEIAKHLVGPIADSSDAFEPWQAFAHELQDAKRARSRGDLISAWTHANLANFLGDEVTKLIR